MVCNAKLYYILIEILFEILRILRLYLKNVNNIKQQYNLENSRKWFRIFRIILKTSWFTRHGI